MKRFLLFLLMLIPGTLTVFGQCTAPNTPLATSLILNQTNTQLAVYFDTTNNSPATNIYYLGIISTSTSLGSGR